MDTINETKQAAKKETGENKAGGTGTAQAEAPYSETLHNERQSGTKTFLLVVVLVLFLVFSVPALSAAGASLGVFGVEYAAYILAAVCAYLLIKGTLTDYRYTLGSEAIAFERVVGKRSRILAAVQLPSIVSLEKEERSEGRGGLRATYAREGNYVLTYMNRDKRERVIFTPTPRLVKKLRDAMAQSAGAGGAGEEA